MPANRLVDNMIKILSGERFAKFVQRHLIHTDCSRLSALRTLSRASRRLFDPAQGTICAMEGSLVEKKRAQRRALLGALYGFVNGREGFSIAPMQYFLMGTQIGLQSDDTGQMIRFLVSEGLLEYKPASEAVALIHKGVVEVEYQSDELRASTERNTVKFVIRG
jgi:hypothetical protein